MTFISWNNLNLDKISELVDGQNINLQLLSLLKGYLSPLFTSLSGMLLCVGSLECTSLDLHKKKKLREVTSCDILFINRINNGFTGNCKVTDYSFDIEMSILSDHQYKTQNVPLRKTGEGQQQMENRPL